jgi:hypothetical protein
MAQSVELIGGWYSNLTAVAPVLERKALLQRVKRKVAARTFGVVIWAGKLGPGRLEASAGNKDGARRSTRSSTGEHLVGSADKAIGVA